MTLDTNIVIAYLDGETVVMEKTTLWRKQGISFLLPVVVEAEVLSFASMTPAEVERAEHFLMENFTSIPMDRWLARKTAELRRSFNMKLPDAAIAATALVTHTPLVTRNAKDFRKVPGIRLLTI